ncbi:universal stress protein [Asanoa iriomotensis]|uniref:universal stress protein n=1 Tax=Asanoa iriomotensis TaxID=234613 RepID=UPI001940B528|nr:universal stress protein [Asanoa iriomotensis]
MRSIVVGAGGASGPLALAWALADARATGADLVLCHAHPPVPAPAVDAGSDSAPAGLHDPALARLVADIRAGLGGHRVTLRLAPGNPGDLILTEAGHADLVVVGPPGRSAPGRRETTHRVVAHATVPVVVARSRTGAAPGPFAGHVVVGVDGSAPSRAALEFGFREAALHHRPLAAVHVTADRREDYWFDDVMLSAHFAAEPAGLDLLAGETERLHHQRPDVAVKRAVFAGRPADGLLRAGAGAALLCLGDRGRSWPARALLGSVTDRAVDCADAPVAVVR